jgi:sRNA-binding regulator protein Hfq
MGIREELGLPTTGSVRAYAPRREQRQRPQAANSRKEGHDALIDMLRHKNVRINIVSLSGETFTGRLSQSDRFTISYYPDGATVPTIFFKHAIESFSLDIQE